MGPSRFELESLAPQARRIPSYPTGPIIQGNRFYVKRFTQISSERRDLADEVSMRYDHPAAAVSVESHIIKNL